MRATSVRNRRLNVWGRVEKASCVHTCYIRTVSEAEARRLLHAPDTNAPGGIRDHALLFVFFKTACRCSAVANARVGNVERTDTDFYLMVREKGGKLQRKALLEAAPPLLRYLEVVGIMDDIHGPLFRPLAKDRRHFLRQHLTRQAVWKIVKKYARDAGVHVDRLGGRGVGVHSLRKTALTKGKNKGAGNPAPKLGDGYSTSYLWKVIWARDRLLELMQYFVMDVRDRDDDGKLQRKVIFPRYHQLDGVRCLIADARENGPGENYLIQHSAGSGKSNTIAWLAHRLASLHGPDEKRVFDSVIIVTDRVALDRQLSNTVSSFEQTAGLVEHIDKGGKHLKEALEAGKQIIVTTLQKFPVVLDQVRKMEDEWKKQQQAAGNRASASARSYGCMSARSQFSTI